MSHPSSLAQQLQDTKIAYQLAFQNSRFKAGFLGRIAHEIRSPLTSLMGLQQLIIADLCESPEEEKEFINEGYKYAKKLMELIDILVEVSKLEIGKIDLDIKKISLNNTVTDITRIMILQAANRNLKLKFSPMSEDIIILADQEKLSQLLFFLIEIVIDYSEFGAIQLTTEKNIESSSFAYINIDFPDTHLSISEPISLIDPPIEELKQLNNLPQLSNGMKLILAQTLLETMGGKLQLTDKSQETTRLRLSLPLAESNLSAETL